MRDITTSFISMLILVCMGIGASNALFAQESLPEIIPCQQEMTLKAPMPKSKATLPTIQLGAKWSVTTLVHGDYITMDSKYLWVYHNTYTTHYALTTGKEFEGKSYLKVSGTPEDLYVREDLSTGKIYAYYNEKSHDKKTPAEHVIFDYNWQVGDTIPLYDQYGYSSLEEKNRALGYLDRYVLVITDIQTEHLYGADRLVYKMRDCSGVPLPSSEVYWVEGIGYSFGFLFVSGDVLRYDLTGSYLRINETYPLCYTAPNGDVYPLNPRKICEPILRARNNQSAGRALHSTTSRTVMPPRTPQLTAPSHDYTIVRERTVPPTPKAHPTLPTIQAGSRWMVYSVTYTKSSQTSPPVNEWRYQSSFTDVYELTTSQEFGGETYLKISGGPRNIKPSYVREDLSTGQIYAYNEGASEEHVIFDYNWQVGDTIPLYDQAGYSSLDERNRTRDFLDHYVLVITDIRTEHIYGADRLVYKMRDCSGVPLPSSEVYWVEGIGYSFGFLFAPDEILNYELTGHFNCIKDTFPLCYKASNGDGYFLSNAKFCRAINGYRANEEIAPKAIPLDVRIARDREGLTLRIADDKPHHLTVYRYDGSMLLEPVPFFESYSVTIPMNAGEKLLLVVDDQVIPYML